MSIIATKTYMVAVIERALAYYLVEADDARSAAENWQEGDFRDRDDEALDTEGPCTVREKQPDGRWRTLSPSEWEVETKPYSVLLLYPDYLDDTGYETHYALVDADDPMTAVSVAQSQAADAQQSEHINPVDFHPLLVILGHHRAEALFNK
jgi:hypothetical protein